MSYKPRRKGGARDTAISIRLGTGLRRELQRRAKADGRSLSSYMRRLLEKTIGYKEVNPFEDEADVKAA